MLLALLGVTASAPGAQAQAPTDSTIQRRIDRVVRALLVETPLTGRYSTATLMQRMRYYHTPGVSIAVINRSRLEWARGFGVREAGAGDSVTDRTLFQAASISKPIFAMAVMRLAQERRLDLAQDVNTYLQSWKVPPSEGWQPLVTLRQLLSHSAGMTVHGFPGYLRSETLPTLLQALDGEGPANTPPVRVNLLPGTQLRYSGGGTAVAQQLVVDVLGRPFPEIMRDVVLQPVGMANSTYQQPLPDSLARYAATAHPWKARPVEGKWHVYPEMAAAGLWTTASDLARAGIEMQRALTGDTSRLLSPEIAQEMLTPQPALQGQIGLGFFLEGEGDSTRFHHSGWNEGFVARMTVYRKGGYGAVVMMNSNEGADMLSEIMRAIAREYEWPGYVEERPPSRALPASVLRRYLGRYASAAGLRFLVREEAGTLLLSHGRGRPAALAPVAPDSFAMPALNATVSFTADKRRRITALLLEQEGSTIVAKREGP
ncbi:MAG: serine hydrolase [Gemmatimonadales bacterium]|nr:serine hydrolase [Gemmatimonadales bacterium]